MYNPDLGTFNQRDPIGYRGGMDLYEYCGDDPLNKTDPSGNRTCGAPVVLSYGTATVTAEAGGFSASLATNPFPVDHSPVDTLICSCTRPVNVRYTCTDTITTHYGFCNLFSTSKTVTYPVFVTQTQVMASWTVNISNSNSIFVVGPTISAPYNIPLAVGYSKIAPGDQKMANRLCGPGAPSKPYTPFPTIP